MIGRPRLSIPLQLTGLAVLVTMLAVVVTSSMSDHSGRVVLTENEVMDLGDKSNLWLLETQSALLSTARGLRSLSTALGKYGRIEDLAHRVSLR